MTDTFLQGRTALVTGSTSGIGLAIASALATAGAKVAINGLGSPEQIAAAIAEVDAAGNGGTRHFGADLRDPTAIDTMMAELTDWSGGGVDILVNNAGIQHAVPLHAMPVAKWNDIIAINLSSAFHTMRAAMPWMAARGYGRVVNVASVHGLVASKDKAPYVASKFGLVGLSKGAALEYAAQGSRESGGVRAAFAKYFAGDVSALDAIDVDPGGTPFQSKVWLTLREIGAGETWSYEDLARRVGSPAAMRAVGAANGANPIPLVLPCHRVIGKSGKLVGYGGGLDRKAWLLRHEGSAATASRPTGTDETPRLW